MTKILAPAIVEKKEVQPQPRKNVVDDGERLASEICLHLAEGNTAKNALAMVGMSAGTYHEWLEGGKACYEAYETGEDLEEREMALMNFYKAISMTRALASSRKVKTISDAADNGNWQAAHCWLKTMDPEDWSNKTQVDVKHDGHIQFSPVTDEEVKHARAFIRAATKNNRISSTLEPEDDQEVIDVDVD